MKLRVMLAFEFEDISPDSAEEDDIVNSLSVECERMAVAFDAQSCWVDNAFYTTGE